MGERHRQPVVAGQREHEEHRHGVPGLSVGPNIRAALSSGSQIAQQHRGPDLHLRPHRGGHQNARLFRRGSSDGCRTAEEEQAAQLRPCCGTPAGSRSAPKRRRDVASSQQMRSRAARQRPANPIGPHKRRTARPRPPRGGPQNDMDPVSSSTRPASPTLLGVCARRQSLHPKPPPGLRRFSTIQHKAAKLRRCSLAGTYQAFLNVILWHKVAVADTGGGPTWHITPPPPDGDRHRRAGPPAPCPPQSGRRRRSPWATRRIVTLSGRRPRVAGRVSIFGPMPARRIWRPCSDGFGIERDATLHPAGAKPDGCCAGADVLGAVSMPARAPGVPGPVRAPCPTRWPPPRIDP